MNNENLKKIIEKFNQKKAIVGIFGLGYVGIPLLINFSKKNFRTIGFDIDIEKIKKLSQGISPIKHIKDQNIKEIEKFKVEFTTNLKKTSSLDAIIVCLPTPLDNFKIPDLSLIKNLLRDIGPYVKRNAIISIESTVYPGACEELVNPIIKNKNFILGKDIFLTHSPEREDPGNKYFDISSTPKVVGCNTKNCASVAESLYRNVVSKLVKVSSIKTAELTKLTENIYRAVNIGLVNELKIIAYNLGVDIHEVIKAASTKPFGFNAFYPGPGLGGHCIPVDPLYLTHKIKELDLTSNFIEHAAQINAGMPFWIMSQISKFLNKQKTNFNSLKVIVFGVAYKKNIDDVRESPALKMIELLLYENANVSYYDPHVRSISVRHKNKNKKINSQKFNLKNLKRFDFAIIVTDHDDVDYQAIKNAIPLIADSRNVYKSKSKKILKI